MKFSQIFIKRPIFAAVLSVLILIVGGLAYVSLPTSQFPDVAPPTIEVVASYPGANAKTLSETVAAPIEKEINGVEDMIYMTSQSSADGRVIVQIAFKLGTDLDKAQVQVQNRVAIAEPRLPESVRRLGVTTRKVSPDMLMVINLYSPEQSGTIESRAVMDNNDHLLEPGMFGKARISGSEEHKALMIPDEIIGTNQSLRYVYVLDEEHKVSSRNLTLGPLHSNGLRIVRSGLQPKDQLIINNLQKIRPGMPVSPKVVDIPLPDQKK